MNLKFAVIITAFIFTFFSAKTVLADIDCTPFAGQPGPHSSKPDGTPKGNGGFTGNDCSKIPGGNPGPDHYSDSHSCVGDVECHVYSYYCARAGTALCEEQYTETLSCTDPKVPVACKGTFAPQTAVGKAFGRIIPPSAIQQLGFGAAGISKFLSNLVVLIYSVSVIIVLFMFFWASFDWITSSGEKEKLASAQKRIVNAVVGLVLLASSFAILKVLSTFTGFSFFK